MLATVCLPWSAAVFSTVVASCSNLSTRRCAPARSLGVRGVEEAARAGEAAIAGTARFEDLTPEATVSGVGMIIWATSDDRLHSKLITVTNAIASDVMMAVPAETARS